MNRYGRLALDHNRRHRPQAFAQILDPDQFFTLAGMSIEADVTTARDRMIVCVLPGQDHGPHSRYPLVKPVHPRIRLC